MYTYSPEGIRTKVFGSEYPKLIALDRMIGEKNLIPKAIRLCVIYYLAFGTFPKIGEVSEKMIAESKGMIKNTVIKFEPDGKTAKFLNLLSNNGKLNIQLLMFTEKCIGVCEEGEEWGCNTSDLQNLLIVAHSKKEGLPYDESLIKTMRHEYRGTEIRQETKTPEPDAAKEVMSVSDSVAEEPAEEEIEEALVTVFSNSLLLSTKAEMRKYVLSQKGLDSKMAESWVNFIRRKDKKADIEWKTGVIRMCAAQNDESVW